MGACASFPKTLGDAPAPEQPKEESTATETVVVADKAVEEVKTTVDGEDQKEKSLGSLLETTEEGKEAAAPVVEDKEEEKAAAPAAEEKKTEAAVEEPKKE